jgi:two-component system sensor histidine kinase CpxA
MTIRLPLYGKILAWFFLNLVVVAGVFAILFDAQFHFSLDWLLAAGARDRLEAVRDLIIGELEVTSPDEWEQVMQRYSEAHHVKFALFDEEATPLVGGLKTLPEEVRARILARPEPGRFRPPSAAGPPEFSTPPAARPGEPARRWRLPIRALMRTTNPRQYWLLASSRLDNLLAGGPMRVVLVVQSNTISAGGLILDPKPWLALGFGVVAFSLVFWLPLVRGITRTIARMMQTTRQIADGRLDVRVNLQRSDELGALGESIDQMGARLAGLVAGQKRFLGDIAHELCSPLARMQMALGILEQRATPEQAAYVKSAREKAEQIAALVGELLSFSKASFGASAVRLQTVNIAAIAAEAVRRERTETSDIRTEVPDDLHTSAEPDLLTRAIANILRNAIRHAGNSGPISIAASRRGEEIEITVTDSGPGVPEDELPRIFDAFYRVDASRTRDTGGTGLGLAIVKTCVESCAGGVTARNRNPHGLEVTITLHAADKITPELSPV